ncbi:MAG: hypothetical protein ACHQCH_00565 [Solirubrobacterales bacterium]
MSLVLVVLIAGGVTIAVAGSGNASASITAAQAAAFIRAVELQPGDFPASAPYVGEPGSPPEAAEFQRLLHCGHRGRPRGVTVGAERSLLADRYRDWIGEVVASVVIVMPSEALAKAEIATLRSPSGRTCMAHDLRSSGLGTGGPDSPVYATSITYVPVAHLLGPEAVMLHWLARLRRSPRVGLRRGRGFPPPAKLVYSVEALFRVGAADIVFYTLSEHRLFPAATEDRLLALLHTRAEEHKL